MPGDGARPIQMAPAFQYSFHNAILQGLACVGKYNGKNPSLTVATAGGKVLIHSPHEQQAVSAHGTAKINPTADIKVLNINKTPTALVAGPLNPRKAMDLLMIGTESSLQAYSVENNADAFYNEVQDGVNAMCYGTMTVSDIPMVMIGGNCSINGFDAEGEETFWTVTGDNVTALTLIPWLRGGNALIAGAEDFQIRVFQGQDIVTEFTETDKITHLADRCAPGRFIYALANGTVGVYNGQERAWRYKSKHRINSVTACDVDFDGIAEVVCGWSNGKMEVRSDAPGRGGESIFKEVFSSSISAVTHSDYRLEGRDMPIVCTYDGEVRGFVALESAMDEALETHEQQLLEKLMQVRQNMAFEVQSLQQQIDKQRTGQQDSNLPSVQTDVTCKLRPNAQTKSIEVVLTAEGAVIRGAIISADQLFGSVESCFVYGDHPTESLVCPFALEKDVATELNIQAIVGFNMSETFQVHDLKFKLPKFAMYVPMKEFTQDPDGYVTMRVAERISRLQMWLSSSFSFGAGTQSQANDTLQARFVSLRNGVQVLVKAEKGEVTIASQSIEICGDIVQDLAEFLGLQELQSTCDFPQELKQFQDVLHRVDQLHSVRMKLTAEIADSTHFVKALVIKAEDARILNDMKLMKKLYGSLYEVNRGLMTEYLQRSNNHTELLGALKEVNSMIQKAGRLRVGQAKTQLIAQCREAIKSNNQHGLFKIIRSGKL